MKQAIEVTGLYKRYKGVTAVDGIDLGIAEGEVYSLLGPNGAGKTTTIEILEGDRRRDAGQVRVLGEDPQRAGLAWRRAIGIVLQEASDAGELTVAETVRHFAQYYPKARKPQDVIAMVGLTEHAKRKVRLLSGGQRRRLDVAVGVIGRPRLLFLDEPTTGFDPEARRAFWELIRGLRADGTTIVLTTHYLEEAEALADRVGIVVAGRIVAEGAPAALRQGDGQSTVSWLDGQTRRSVRTGDPTRVIAELGQVVGLTVSQPSLEDVYLSLIGGTRS
jgi:ABC-2 type transport system ATP-binding protein